MDSELASLVCDGDALAVVYRSVSYVMGCILEPVFMIFMFLFSSFVFVFFV